jgi:hypothetical protein
MVKIIFWCACFFQYAFNICTDVAMCGHHFYATVDKGDSGVVALAGSWLRVDGSTF